MTTVNSPAIVPTSLDLMTKYGITEVPAVTFAYSEYRYSNLRDAIDQAERDRSRGVFHNR